MTVKPLKKGATYDDLVRVPEHFVAEMFDGELYASPRPALPHVRAAGVLLGKLGDSFDFGDGPGGWLLLVEPELHFSNVLALEAGSFAQLDEHHGNAIIRARPFDAVELELRALWI